MTPNSQTVGEALEYAADDIDKHIRETVNYLVSQSGGRQVLELLCKRGTFEYAAGIASTASEANTAEAWENICAVKRGFEGDR